MESYFWVGKVLDNFLFEGLNTKSWQGLFGICCALTSLALIYEGLHVLKRFFLNRFLKTRKALRRRSLNLGTAVNSSQPSSSSSRPFLTRRIRNSEDGSGEPAPRSLLEESDGNDERSSERDICSTKGFLDLTISSALHSIYMFLGFTLMNAVMTFNVWVFIAIGIGIGIGYFFFGNYRIEDNLIQPLVGIGTETTSLETEVTFPPAPMIHDGGGDCPQLGGGYLGQRFQVRDRNTEEESSRLIVGAQVHTPQVIPGSSASPS